MERSEVQRLARVLRGLVFTVFVCNLLVMPLVPGLVVQMVGGGSERLLVAIRAMMGLSGSLAQIDVWHFLLLALIGFWSDPLICVVTVAYWLCGTCTAVILWQAKKVLDTVLRGNPFQMANALALKQAAVSCWIISAAALVRLVWWFWREGNIAPLFTYNALFVPGFFMAGLLFLVMSALFRQAAELKEDQDLTI